MVIVTLAFYTKGTFELDMLPAQIPLTLEHLFPTPSSSNVRTASRSFCFLWLRYLYITNHLSSNSSGGFVLRDRDRLQDGVIRGWRARFRLSLDGQRLVIAIPINFDGQLIGSRRQRRR